jgi:hypothetical protein
MRCLLGFGKSSIDVGGHGYGRARHLAAAGRAELDGKKSVGRELWEDSECIALLLLAEPCA